MSSFLNLTNRKPRILVLGKVGAGKSHLCHLLNQNAAEPVRGRRYGTAECLEYDAQVKDVRFSVVDTPGIFVTSPSDTKENLQRINRLIEREGVSGLIYIIKMASDGRFEDRDYHGLAMLKAAVPLDSMSRVALWFKVKDVPFELRSEFCTQHLLSLAEEGFGGCRWFQYDNADRGTAEASRICESVAEMAAAVQRFPKLSFKLQLPDDEIAAELERRLDVMTRRNEELEIAALQALHSRKLQNILTRIKEYKDRIESWTVTAVVATIFSPVTFGASLPALPIASVRIEHNREKILMLVRAAEQLARENPPPNEDEWVLSEIRHIGRSI
jgi:hypothetical protein